MDESDPCPIQSMKADERQVHMDVGIYTYFPHRLTYRYRLEIRFVSVVQPKRPASHFAYQFLLSEPRVSTSEPHTRYI
jgi:hypothetical protein